MITEMRALVKQLDGRLETIGGTFAVYGAFG